MARKKAKVKKKVRPAPKAAARKTAPKKTRPKAPMAKKSRSNRASWLDESSNRPLIEKYARQLNSFMEAMADGRIEESELAAQEGRLVRLMKEVEPLLSDTLHEKITRLLCELTAYDLMQMLHSMQETRPQTTFHG